MNLERATTRSQVVYIGRSAHMQYNISSNLVPTKPSDFILLWHTPVVSIGHNVYRSNLSAYIKSSIVGEDIAIAEPHHYFNLLTIEDLPLQYPSLVYISKKGLTAEEEEFQDSTSRKRGKGSIHICTLRSDFKFVQRHLQLAQMTKINNLYGALNYEYIRTYATVRFLTAGILKTNVYPASYGDEGSYISQELAMQLQGNDKEQYVIERPIVEREVDKDTMRVDSGKTKKRKRKRVTEEIPTESKKLRYAIRDYIPKIARYRPNDSELNCIQVDMSQDNQERCVWFPFSEQLALPDDRLVPNFVANHLFKNLGPSPEIQNSTLRTIFKHWPIISTTTAGRIMDHVIFCIDLALKCQGLCRLIYREDRGTCVYRGCAIIGDFNFCLPNDSKWISSCAGLRNSLKLTSQRSIGFEELGVIFPILSNDLRNCENYITIRKILLKEKHRFSTMKSQIIRALSKLGFENGNKERTTENIVNLVQSWSKGTLELTDKFGLNPKCCLEDDERIASLGYFGNLSFSFVLQFCSEVKISTLLQTVKEDNFEDYRYKWVSIDAAIKRMNVVLNRGVVALKNKRDKAPMSFIKSTIGFQTVDNLMTILYALDSLSMEPKELIIYEQDPEIPKSALDLFNVM